MNKSLLNWEPSELIGKSLWSQLLDWDSNIHPYFASPESDIYENDDAWCYKISAPGINQEDVRITIENNVLTLRGETKNETINENTKVYRREMKYGSFSRSFRLPDNIIPEQAHAKVENGVILVEIPKKQIQEEKPKALEIPVNIKSLE